MDESTFLTTLTRVVGALHRADVPFALAGGAAVYARGGPHSHHDIDLLVEPSEAERAAKALAEAGMSRVQPPEDWLLKVFDGEVLVDLIHHLGEIPVSAETISGAPPVQVGSVIARVITATDLMVQKLAVLDCHRCDFAELLIVARILREQVDWPQVRRRLRNSPFAEAFWQLLRGLSIVDDDHPAQHQPPAHLVAVVRRTLAEDPEIGELGIGIDIDDDSVCLTGSVNGPQRRATIESAVRRLVGPRNVINDIEVVQLVEPAEQVTG
ncbi:nucleotidyltransferase [Mycolicibacter heraklionensis]|uniref:Nucleotidyltransferase n=1 Tax=Mycolicibacter heraklionensis TaxID=512402 RepID=A0A9X7ZFP9_9MYCO|nr:nucleotidyltransferase [Mycolicibacter heraklionensis]QZA06727.1 nucleotidyltransferase [Mycolicibacter heraklionensis]